MAMLITGLCENLDRTRSALFWLSQAGYSETDITLCLKSNALAGEWSRAVVTSATPVLEGKRPSELPSSLLELMLLQASITFPECDIILAGQIVRHLDDLSVRGMDLPEWLALIGVPPHRIPYYLHGMQLGGLTLAVRVPKSDCLRVSANLGYWGRGMECHDEPEMPISYRFAIGDAHVSILAPHH